MITYELPHSINRFDTYEGTIVSTNKAGVEIVLDSKIKFESEHINAFAFCGGHIGQRVLVSIKHYNSIRDNFIVSIDSFLLDKYIIFKNEAVA